MRIIIFSIVGIGVVGLVVFLSIVLLNPKNDSTVQTEPVFQVQENNHTPSTVTRSSNVSMEEKTAIATTFYDQVEMPLPPTLGDVFVANEYALQVWNDGYSGGEVLLHLTDSGWVVMPEATSVWSVADLVDVGVPRETAELLVSRRGY